MPDGEQRWDIPAMHHLLWAVEARADGLDAPRRQLTEVGFGPNDDARGPVADAVAEFVAAANPALVGTFCRLVPDGALPRDAEPPGSGRRRLGWVHSSLRAGRTADVRVRHRWCTGGVVGGADRGGPYACG